MDSRSIKVIVADDHNEMLTVVSAFLDQHFCLQASVASGDSLIRTALELRPDVIVSDIDMPGYDGVAAMLRLKALGVEIPFVLMDTETKGIKALLDLGAAAYVHKYDVLADLVDAVISANFGCKFVSRSVSEPRS